MYIPSGSAIAKLVLLNTLVLSLAFMGPPIIDLMQNPSVGSIPYKYSNSIMYEDYEYFLHVENIDGGMQWIEDAPNIHYDTRQVNLVVLGPDEFVRKIPVLTINDTEINPANTSFWGYSLMKVDRNYAYIHINYEAWQHTGWNGWNRTEYYQDFVLRLKYNSGLQVDDIDSTLPSVQIISLQNVDNHSLSQTYQSEFSEDFIGIFEHKMREEDFVEYYANDSYQDTLVISQHMFPTMNEAFIETEVQTNPMWTTFQGEQIDIGKIPQLDIDEVLLEEFGDDRGLVDLHGMKDIDLLLVDSSGTYHFSGQVNFYNDVEGNGTGINRPEYLAINPSSGQFQFWDITPWGQPFEGPPKIIEIGGGEIILVLYGPIIDGFYENPDLVPPVERNETNDPLWDWYRNKEKQLVRFNPLNPQNENYIQFDKTVSGRDSHTIEFPRPVMVDTIDHTDDRYWFLDPLVVYSNNQFYVFTAQYVTETGLAEEIYYGEIDGDSYTMRTSQDLSIVAHQYDLHAGLDYMGYTKIIGPENAIRDYYEHQGDPDEFEYAEQDGWGIYHPFSAFLQEDTIHLYFSGYYEPLFTENKLYLTKINIEEDLK